jgi:hypothetical protein
MKTKSLNLRTLMGSCLAFVALAVAPIAQSQSNASSQAPATLASMETRSSFATHLENQLRQGGADARVQLGGDYRDVLNIEWQGVHRSDIYNFVTSSAADHARQLGFASFTFTDASQRWDYDLSRESMVVSPAQP